MTPKVTNHDGYTFGGSGKLAQLPADKEFQKTSFDYTDNTNYNSFDFLSSALLKNAENAEQAPEIYGCWIFKNSSEPGWLNIILEFSVLK